MLEFSWRNKILNYYRHIFDNGYFEKGAKIKCKDLKKN